MREKCSDKVFCSFYIEMLDFIGGLRLFFRICLKEYKNNIRNLAMSRRCMITGKGVMSGNNVSHALNRTKRKFLPNTQDTSLYSEVLDRWVKIRTTAAGLRTVEHKGGFDAYLQNTASTKLDPVLRPIKAQVEAALAA